VNSLESSSAEYRSCYSCVWVETGSVALREEHKVKVLENRVLGTGAERKYRC